MFRDDKASPTPIPKLTHFTPSDPLTPYIVGYAI
jgi:hypothetical protein